MKPIEEITIWERLKHKTGEWEHNHIEEGWSSLDAPLPQNQKQAKNWKGASWKKGYGYIQENRVHEFGGKALGEVVLKQSPDGLQASTTSYKAFQFKEDRPKFNCLDCGKDTCNIQDDYWIEDELWLSIVPEWTGHLCLHCLRIWLSRDLQLADFMLEYEVNSHINQELLDRINK